MYVVHSFGIGGLEKCVVDLVNGLDRKQFRPSICCLTTNGPSSEKLTAECRIFEMNKKPGNDVMLPFKLARLFRRENVHIVHSGNWGTFLEALFGARLARVPVSVHMKQGMELEEFSDHAANGKALKISAQRLFARSYDRLVVVSDEIRDHFADKMRVPKTKIDVIPNSVNVEYYRPDKASRWTKRRELGLKEDTVLIGSVGRLSRVKNYISLIEAMARVVKKQPNARLALIGDGPERRNLERRIAKLGVNDSVSLLGQRFDTRDLLNAMDIFVLPSFSEGISFSILEAMATGLPVIATRVGGNPELVEQDITGHLYASNNIDELADAIFRYISKPHLRAKNGARGRGFVEEKFSLNSMIDRYTAIYLSGMQSCWSEK